MPSTLDFGAHGLVAVTRSSLAALRAALHRDAGSAAGAYLQEAGYAGGEDVFASMMEWQRARGGGELEELPLMEFTTAVSEYFRETGWGTVDISGIREALAVIDAREWAEAETEGTLDHPSCHFSTGVFAYVFGRVADQPLAVLEVECRSSGAQRCRFLVGSAEVMEYIYDEMGRGIPYEESAAQVE